MYNLFFLLLVLIPSVYAHSDKEKGLLWGSLYGDAFGGPYEFQKVISHPLIKQNKKLTKAQWKKLAQSVKLVDYQSEASSYGTWKKNAPKGSITDDSRHKIIFWHSYKKSKKTDAKSVARAYISYYKKGGDYQKWLQEIVNASYFYLDNNDLKGKPLERLYGGIPTLLGQMVYLPMAIIYPKKPRLAYTETFKHNFLDIGYAKDFTSAVLASLSYALNKNANLAGIKETILKVDPYGFSNAAYIKRLVSENLALSEKLVRNAKGNPKQLFKLLEENLKARTWWEAEVSFVVVMSFLEMTKNEPLAALALCREFGHDVDSYAQLVGAYLGSLYGESIFPKRDLTIIKGLIKNEFKEVLSEFL